MPKSESPKELEQLQKLFIRGLSFQTTNESLSAIMSTEECSVRSSGCGNFGGGCGGGFVGKPTLVVEDTIVGKVALVAVKVVVDTVAVGEDYHGFASARGPRAPQRSRGAPDPGKHPPRPAPPVQLAPTPKARGPQGAQPPVSTKRGSGGGRGAGLPPAEATPTPTPTPRVWTERGGGSQRWKVRCGASSRRGVSRASRGLGHPRPRLSAATAQGSVQFKMLMKFRAGA
nr:formin-like protein 20 [Vulpes vulpes]